MIVVLVYRPEAMEGPHQASYQDDFDPFNGIELYGTYMDAEDKHVMAMIDDLMGQHPDWKFHVDVNVTTKVGFNVATANIPKPTGRRKR